MSETKTITAVVELNPFDIASDWSDEDAAQFVKELDEAIASWPFTLAMYEFFAAQKAAYDAEEAAAAAKESR